MLQSGPPAEPSSPEFAARLAASGRTFAEAGVTQIYCIHGTFCGNDPLGLYTELARFAPRLSESLRKATKRVIDAVLGETGNYTPQFAARMEAALSAGAGRALPVRLFNWSSQNNHIGRADGAVRLIDELSRSAKSASATATHAPSQPPRVMLWGHSHGGNAMALVSNLLAADQKHRGEFFHAARTFYRRWRSHVIDMPAWQRVEALLADPSHPLRQLQLDMVTFGTPTRYGWDSGGHAKLLHLVNHRPAAGRPEHVAPYPPRPWRVLTGVDGDLMQHIGIAGTNFIPLPLAIRTLIADWRLGRLLERDLTPRWLRSRLKHGVRVPEDGRTLLVDYDDPARFPLSNFVGHALYSRSRWLPHHCEWIAEAFYSEAKQA